MLGRVDVGRIELLQEIPVGLCLWLAGAETGTEAEQTDRKTQKMPADKCTEPGIDEGADPMYRQLLYIYSTDQVADAIDRQVQRYVQAKVQRQYMDRWTDRYRVIARQCGLSATSSILQQLSAHKPTSKNFTPLEPPYRADTW